MEYINPGSLMGSVGGLDSIDSPFLRSFERGNRELQAAPFLEMAKRQQQLELIKKQKESEEFLSDPFVQARLTNKQVSAAKDQQEMRRLPFETDALISTAQNKTALAPDQLNKDRAVLQQQMQEALAAPGGKLLKEIASAEGYIRQHPVASKYPLFAESLRKSFVQQWQAANPGVRLPEAMLSADPERWGMIHHTVTNTPEHMRSKETIGIQNDARMNILQNKLDSAERQLSDRLSSQEEIARLRREQAAAQGSGRQPSAGQQENIWKDIINGAIPSTPEQKAQARASLRMSSSTYRDFNKQEELTPNAELKKTTREQRWKAYLRGRNLLDDAEATSPAFQSENDTFKVFTEKLKLPPEMVSTLISKGVRFKDGKIVAPDNIDTSGLPPAVANLLKPSPAR